MIKLAIFASGSGSNAENIIKYFQDSNNVNVSLIASNNPSAFVLERAEKLGIPTYVFNRNKFYHSEDVLTELQSKGIDMIILAGFMWLVPSYLIKAFPDRIINIHPALLPKYGGKGMYGDHVHKAVSIAGESETGITIHYVNERYDEGNIIFQQSCLITPNESPDKIASKVHELEYQCYPQVIESTIKKSFKNT